MASDGTLKFDTQIDSSGFQKGISSIGNIAEKGLQATGNILKGSITAIAGLGAAAIKVGSDFEAGMSKVAAISGASEQELAKLTEKAKEMGSTTKFSATESAAAFEYMAMAGWKTEDMLEGIEGIMSLAAASGEDLATTSDIVTDALTAFGMKASDAGHFSDILAQASSNANTNVGMMGETFKYVAPVAGALGYTAEDTALAIGLMANAGIKGSQAGTSLRSMMSRLTKPTKEVQNAMNRLGLSLTDGNGKMKSLNEIMADLRTGFNGLSEAEAAELASSLAGQEAMSGLLAIVNASDDDFKKLERSIYNCDGAAARMAETMSNNLQGQITILKSGLEGLAISLYENMQAPCMEIVKTAQEMVQELQEAFDNGGLDGLVTTFGDILSRIVESVANAAPDLIEAATNLVSSFCDSLKSSPSIGDAAASLITALVTGFFSCADDIWTTAIVLAGKMADGLAEGAPKMAQAAAQCIGDIIECIIDWAPDFIDAGKRIIEGIIQGIGEEFPALGAFLSGLFDGFTSTLEPILSGVISIVEGIFSALGEADPATMEALGKAIGTIAAAMVTMHAAKAAASNIQSVISVVTKFAGSIKTVLGVIPKLIEGFQLLSGGAGTFSEVLALEFPKLAGIISKIGSVFSTVKSVISSIGSTVGGVAAVIGGSVMAITNFFDMLKNGFSWLKEALMVVGVAIAAIGAVILGAPAAIAAVVAGIIAAVATLVVVIKDHWTQIVDFFKNLGSAIADFFKSIPDTVRNLVDQVVQFFSELPERISTWLTNTINNVKAWGAEMLASAIDTARNFIDNIITFICELPNKIAYWLGYAIGTVIKWGLELYNWVTTEVPRIIDEIVTFFSELPGKIWTWLVDTVNKVIQWGINLKNTAETWVKNTINSVVKFFSELPEKVATWLTSTVNKVIQWGKKLLTEAGNAAQNAVNKVVEWFKQLPDKVATWLTSTVAKVTQFASDLKDKAISAAKNFVENLVDGVKSLPDKFKEIGSDIVKGIWEGISSGWEWLKDKVKELAESLLKGAKDALGIKSPSKLFSQQVGRWIPPGIGVGMEKAMPDLQKQVDAEMEELASRMQTAVAIETGGITVRTRASAEHNADTEYPKGGGDTYIDQHIEQENNYHVPVASPAEVSKSQREAARKLLGGVK
ncbi:MAG: phage tail tape measure protein [Lachnospiraceae bacterium]|nr:phage tail tape measure protein [Lachnospiraceae bacterium]